MALPLLGVLFDIPYQLLIAFSLAYVGALIGYCSWHLLQVLRKSSQQTLMVYSSLQFYSGVRGKVGIGIRRDFFKNHVELRLPIEIETLEPDHVWVKDESVPEYKVWTCEFSPRARGEILFDRAVVRVSDHFGILSFQIVLGFEQRQLRVILPNPGLEELVQLPGLFRANAGNAAILRLSGGAREFDSLRHYVPGDDLRKVDWKRSAKGRGLLVKSYRPESHQRIHLIIDCGRRLSTTVEGRERIEFATDATAHLLQTTADTDDEFAFFAFNSDVLHSIGCRRGRGQHKVILDAVQDIKVGQFESDYQLLTRWALREHRRSLLLVISSASNSAGIESIAKALLPVRSRHLAVLLAIADTDLTNLLSQSADSLLDAYAVAAAREQQTRIDSALALVGRQGIKAVYTDARSLSLELRNAYIEAKQSGRL